MWRQVTIAMALYCVATTATARDARNVVRDAWKPQQVFSLAPGSLQGLPEDAAGCVVVGYYILADGTVAKPRVMQGAYTRDVPAEAQRRFEDGASAAVAGMKFRYDRKATRPLAAFGWTVLGFAEEDGQASRLVVDRMHQDPRMGDACALDDLAAWGTTRAVSAAQAIAADDGRTLAPYLEPVEAFWADIEAKIPPRYPPDAYRSNVQGCVVVGMLVRQDGTPEGLRIMKSDITRGANAPSRKALENAALQAASKWRFAPGPDNPHRLRAFIQIPVEYALGDGPAGVECAPLNLAALNPAKP